MRIYATYLSCLLLLLMNLPSYAQMPKGLTRFEIGISYPMITAQYEEKYSAFDFDSFENRDTSFSTKLRSKMAYGVSLGSYIPLSNMGGENLLALSIFGYYNLVTWEYGLSDYIGYEEDAEVTFSSKLVTAASVQIGMPVGIDFKTGADAVQDKSRTGCFTIGVGVNPYISLTGAGSDAGTHVGARFKVHPYVKGEVGFFKGICMKARVLYTLGKINYFSSEYEYGFDDYSYSSEAKFTSNSTLTLSLIFMPLSFGWSKSDWWR